MEKIKTQKLSNLCLKTAYLLINGGAETYRVEDTVERIGRSLGSRVVCYVTVTAIFIEVNNQNYKFTKSVLGGTNLQMIDEINTMSRSLADRTLTPEDFTRRINQLYRNKRTTDFRFPVKAIGAGFVSMAPMLLFQMPGYYFIYCFIVGVIGYSVSYYLSHLSMLPYADLFISSFVIAVLGILLKNMGLVTEYHDIIIGAIMPLVPGVAITNAIRELVMRQALSSMVRFLDALLVASSIGFGIASALIIF
ncbi:threonine/serine exporter family protein [Companilactobacillus mishanensis]|uniref:Threonine/serine exporter family protein n=1 Tax=Companilactobacillus mishanensis TaxID=2486008 RepID=A0A5P0ZJC2_9LACO|nr:threonine/serine exporter family protein [Companilactobacillus mishanensis]MQS45004.1 threonine/serine exporter family protein [Companilactobacillus mishanensis]MQS53193.1 threonine/serine exporter family protein [Companilactobacillus mishanensis]MQS90326.1 threonine/serine exporter family protein [Companilactobacillus mishanensis]